MTKKIISINNHNQHFIISLALIGEPPFLGLILQSKQNMSQVQKAGYVAIWVSRFLAQELLNAYSVVEYLKCVIYINSWSMQERIKMQLTFVGNPSVGKSAFLSQIVKNNNSASLTVNWEMIQRKILERVYEIKIVELSGVEKMTDSKNYKEIQQLIKGTHAVVLVFDVSNNQSFGDVARYWLSFAHKITQTQNLVLLAHKIDKQSVIPIKNMVDFADKNNLQLFFSTNRMNCKKVFDDIVLWVEHHGITQTFLKQLDESSLKPQGLISKFFGISKSTNPEEEALKNKVRQIYSSNLYRLQAVEKCMREKQYAYKQFNINIKKKLIEMYNVIVDSKSKLDQRLSLEKIIMCMDEQLLKSYQEMLNINQKVRNLQEQKQSLLKQANKMVADKKETEQKNQQMVKNLKEQLQSINEKLLASQEQKLKYQFEIKELTQSVATLKLEIIKLKSELEEAKRQKNVWRQSLKNVGSVYAQERQQLNQKLEKGLKLLEQKESIKIFWDLQAFRDIQPSIVMRFKQASQKVTGQRITRCNKIYQFDLCSYSNFHTYLDNNRNLLYAVSLKEAIFIIYAAQIFKSQSMGRAGCFFVWNRKDEFEQLNLNPNIQLWKYDPLSLIFGKGEVIIKFTKNECWLSLYEKKISFIEDRQKNLEQVLHLERKEEGKYEILSLEIFQLDLSPI